MFNYKKVWYFPLLVLMVFFGCLWGEARAVNKRVIIFWGAPEQVLSDRDTTGSGQQAQELLVHTTILMPRLPKAMTSLGKVSDQETHRLGGKAMTPMVLSVLVALMAAGGTCRTTLTP